MGYLDNLGIHVVGNWIPDGYSHEGVNAPTDLRLIRPPPCFL